MNLVLAAAAIHAVTAQGFVKPNTWCQKFCRQILESVFGRKFAAWMRGTARETGQAFLATRKHELFEAFEASEVQAKGGLQEGDILYKTEGSGGFGHVGIYVGNGKVAENSTYHTHDSTPGDARGYRNLGAYGPYQIVVRPTAPKPGRRLIIALPHDSGYIYDVVESAQWEGDHFTVNQSDLAGGLGVKGETVRQGVREALDALGWKVTRLGDHTADVNDPRMYVFVEPE